MKNNKIKEVREISAFFIIFLSFLLFRPSPTLLLGPALGMRIMDLILILLLLGFIFLYKKKKYSIDLNFIILTSLIFLQLFSILFANLKGNVTIEDLFEIFRPVLYLLIYIVIKEITTIRSLNLIYSLLSATLLLGFIELYNLMNLNNLLMYIYDYSKSRNIDSTNWRIVGSFYNPNYYGYFLSIIANLSFVLILYNFRMKYSVLIFLASFYLLFFTGSRTALISVSASLIITIVLFLLKRKNVSSFKKIVITFIILGFSLLFLPMLSDFLSQNFRRYNDSANMSLNFFARVNVWEYSLGWISGNILLGNGPGKSIIKSFDNNYIIILFRYGLVTLLIFLFFIVKTYTLAFKKYFYETNINLTASSLIMISMVNILMITMLTAIPFDFLQTGSLFIASVGVYYSIIGGEKNYG